MTNKTFVLLTINKLHNDFFKINCNLFSMSCQIDIITCKELSEMIGSDAMQKMLVRIVEIIEAVGIMRLMIV